MALGAAPADLLRLFMAQGGWMVAIGVTVGIGAIGLRDSMASFVFGCPTSDPLLCRRGRESRGGHIHCVPRCPPDVPRRSIR